MITLSSADLDDLEALSRSGERKKVIKRLKSINTKRIPRDLKLRVANLARRNHLLLLALRILNPIVRSELVLEKPVTSEEQAEYAVALLNYGALSEAQALLDGLDSEETPEILLYRAFCLFGQWKYKESIQPLELYIDRMRDVDDYQKLVGQVNLCAALIFDGQFGNALGILDEVIDSTKNSGHKLLEGNCWELRAQAQFGLQKFKKAAEDIEIANQRLGRSEDLNNFYVEKWKTIFSVHGMKSPKRGLDRLVELKQSAEENYHWETLRECDFYISVFSKNKNLFEQVYFGTPYESYRKMMVEKWVAAKPKSESFIWNKGQSQVLQIHKGKINEELVFRDGELISRLLSFLFSDFYVPKRVASIFSFLHPEEYFDPNTSPTRVYQLVKRLKQHLKKHKINIEVHSRSGAYHCSLPLNLSIDFSGQVNQSIEMAYLEKLQLNNIVEFKSKDLQSLFSCSRATVTRFLRWGTSQGFFQKCGSGPSQFYKKVS